MFSFEHNRFKFQNAYAVTTVDDALYYVLFVWKQLGMDPQTDELHLAGQTDEMKDRASQFLKRVFVSNPTGEFNRAPVTLIDGMPYDTMLVYLK